MLTFVILQADRSSAMASRASYQKYNSKNIAGEHPHACVAQLACK